MPELSGQKNVILMFDSWYAKKDLTCVADEFSNLDIIGNHMVHAYVTFTLRESGTRRLFFSTISPACITFAYAWYESAPLNQTGSEWSNYVPLFLYKIRWNIETSYYEQKTFWSLCHYMVRSVKGIEMMVNLINVAYCSMKLLPYTDKKFEKYQTQSVQEFRFAISKQIIFASFVESFKKGLNTKSVINLLKQKVFGRSSAAQKL